MAHVKVWPELVLRQLIIHGTRALVVKLTCLGSLVSFDQCYGYLDDLENQTRIRFLYDSRLGRFKGFSRFVDKTTASRLNCAPLLAIYC